MTARIAGGGQLGLQGDRSVALVHEVVHLLRDDVTGLAAGSEEDIGVLEGGGAEFAVTVPGDEVAERGFDVQPVVGSSRKDVFGATGCLVSHPSIMGRVPYGWLGVPPS
jgi:hypothetical protein